MNVTSTIKLADTANQEALLTNVFTLLCAYNNLNNAVWFMSPELIHVDSFGTKFSANFTTFSYN